MLKREELQALIDCTENDCADCSLNATDGELCNYASRYAAETALRLYTVVDKQREALKKAGEAIQKAYSPIGSAMGAMYKANEALTAIDRLIGGGEDV